MTPRHGDMWHEYTPDPKTLFLFCANSTLNSKGELVMGAGSAKVARDMFPGLAMAMGRQIRDRGIHAMVTGFEKGFVTYGVVVSETCNVGAFQTKYYWREPSPISLVRFSRDVLLAHMDDQYDTIHLPYPGIGHGGLTKEQVEPLIIGLPDMVHVWTYK